MGSAGSIAIHSTGLAERQVVIAIDVIIKYLGDQVCRISLLALAIVVSHPHFYGICLGEHWTFILGVAYRAGGIALRVAGSFVAFKVVACCSLVASSRSDSGRAIAVTIDQSESLMTREKLAVQTKSSQS